MNFKIHGFSLILFFGCYLHSQTKTSPIFSSGMVLQQNASVAFWGTDIPGTKVTVKSSWGKDEVAITNKEGKWELFIDTKQAGGPYNVEIVGTSKIELKNVLLGEVWLCSGQSNMEMPMKGFPGQPVTNSNDFILKSKNSNIRLFKVQKNLSKTPTKDYKGSWKEASPEAVRNFSAVAYLYGKLLHENIGVPIGIICSSVGGTRVEAWTSEEALSEIQHKLKAKTKTDNLEIHRNTVSVLYNGMIHPIIPYTIKGAIWYQGESNRRNAQDYATLFGNMVNSWRQEWNMGIFPFYFTQIAPFKYKIDTNSAYLREAQLEALHTIENTGMAVTLDIGEELCIHPANKFDVAKRLSYIALAKTYNFKGLQFSGPIYKSMKIDGDKIHLSFNFAENGVTSFGAELVNFTIAGSDKTFYPAKAVLNRGKLTIYSPEVLKPVAVRYGWTNYFKGNLYNLYGLPASSFRTDDWKN